MGSGAAIPCNAAKPKDIDGYQTSSDQVLLRDPYCYADAIECKQ